DIVDIIIVDIVDILISVFIYLYYLIIFKMSALC
ncbi:MAG: hypothetical protein UT35_C0002G0001, partial [Candidatus Yanofskybacteria bacterium GW2011_GWD1_39_16]